MATIHSVTFTPAVDCTLIVSVTADLFTRRTSGANGSARLYRTQGSTVNGDPIYFTNRGEGSFAQQATFTCTGGSSVTVGLDATRPGIGAYSFSNINLKVEQIKR
jgi:hypothetical protein